MMVRCRSLSATTGSCAAHRGTPLSGAQPTAKHSAPCPVTRWQEQACPQAGSACPKREKRTRNRPRQVACLAWRRHFAVIGEVQWSKSGRGRAIFWAGHGFREMPTLKPRNVTPQQMLQGLIKAGAQVEVCALYLPNSGRQATDLIQGVTPAKPADVATHLLKPGVHTLAF